MTSVRPVRYRPPAVKQWTHAGWGSMYDSRHVAAEQEGEAPILVNLHPLDPSRPGMVQLRAGMQRLTTPTTTRLASNTGWQGVGGFFLGTSGIYKIYLVSAGEIYDLNPATGVLTKDISAANLAAAGITLTTTAGVWLIQFGQTLVVADSVGNVPFVWNGTAGGGLTKLTNAPASRAGAPTVYYGKLFFIKQGTNTLVWSEENQPNTGYEAGGYNNAWSLTQTGGGNLFGILGTNDGLYFWRHDTAGVIRGAATSTFQSDGTMDSISQQTGILLGTRAVWAGEAVWWVAGDGRPMVYRPDVGALDLGLQVQRRFAGSQVGTEVVYLGSIGEQYANDIGLFDCIIMVDRPNERVHFEYAQGVNDARRVLVYDTNTLKLLFVDVYPTVNTPVAGFEEWAAILPHSGSTWPTVVSKFFCDQDGYIFKEPITGGVQIGFDETESGSGLSVEGLLVGPMDGWSTGTEWQFTQIDVVLDGLPDNNMTVGYATSRFHKDQLVPAPQAFSDTQSGLITPFERRIPFGINTSGRWLRPIIKVYGAILPTRQPQIHGYTVTGVPLSATPNVT